MYNNMDLVRTFIDSLKLYFMEKVVKRGVKAVLERILKKEVKGGILKVIDTLKLYTEEYEIKEKNKLICRIDLNNETGEIREKRFYNSDQFNLTVDNRGLFMQFSLPKLYGEESNFNPINYKQCKEVMNSIERILKDIGIITNINYFKVSRMDLFKNIKTVYPFINYSFILHTLNLERTNSRDYGDTYIIMNGQREVCFYDKVKETYLKYKLRLNKINIMRGEIRFKTHKENKKRGFDKVTDIIENWELLKEIYKEIMKKVFNRELEEVKKEKVNKELFIYNLILEIGMKKVIEFLGIREITNIDKERLKKILMNKYCKSEVYRKLKNLKEKEKEYRKYVENDKFEKLYKELKEKFIA